MYFQQVYQSNSGIISDENIRWRELERHIVFVNKTKTSIRCLDVSRFIGPQWNKKERDSSKIHVLIQKYIDSY